MPPRFSVRRTLCAVFLLSSVLGSLGAPPAWWSDPDTRIIDPAAAPENHAPATLGQLKHVATQARRHLDARLAAEEGAGPQIDQRCQFDQTDNHAPLTIGQLKHVAQPFYDRLSAIGFNWETGFAGTPTSPYPWTLTVSADNHALANLGQLKHVFAFELATSFLTTDQDHDGLPDWREKTNGSNPLDPDTDGDGASDKEEVDEQTSPVSNESHPLGWRSIGGSILYEPISN